MKTSFSILILFSSLLFNQCKQRLTIVEIPVLIDDVKSYDVVVEVHFYQTVDLQTDILPKTLDKDTSDLRQSINKHFYYPQLCKEMTVQGTLYFEVSRDSTDNFFEIKTLRGFDQSCTEMVLKEIKRILKMTPIIEVPEEINSFVIAFKIALEER